MAFPLFCGHLPTSLKYALHHLSPGGIFLYLASLSYIISLLGCATSQLWNLNHIISLSSGSVSHHVSKIWTMSPSSSIWSWCCIISPPRACPCNVKVLATFFLKLQGFVGISLHLQNLNESSLQCQSLGGILLETSSSIIKANVGATSVQMKCWRDVMEKTNIGTASVQIKCWRDSMAKMNVGVA